jgi:hypothetical protein
MAILMSLLRLSNSGLQLTHNSTFMKLNSHLLWFWMCCRVPCKTKGGMRFLLNGNPYFQLFLIFNVGGAGDIKSASIKGESTAWLPAGRHYGENWQFGGSLTGQKLSFNVTNFDKVTMVSSNIANRQWQFGMTFEGTQFS